MGVSFPVSSGECIARFSCDGYYYGPVIEVFSSVGDSFNVGVFYRG